MKKIYIYLIVLLFSGMTYIALQKKQEIKLNHDYYVLCKGGIIGKLSNEKKIEKSILNIYDKNNTHNLIFRNTIFIDENIKKIYLDSTFHGIFEYDIKKRNFNKIHKGDMIAYSSRNKKLFYDYKTDLFYFDTSTQKKTYIGKTRPRKGTLFRRRVVEISKDEILFNDIDKVYKYNIKTHESYLTDIEDCDVENVYRSQSNSILCYHFGKNYMLNLKTKKKLYFETPITEPFYYDKEYDLLFYKKLKFDITSRSLEKYVTMVYDFKNTKHYLYNKDCIPVQAVVPPPKVIGK